MASRTPPGPGTGALLRVILDTAPLIAAVSAELRAHRETPGHLHLPQRLRDRPAPLPPDA
ncbi:hypothetical protein ABT263_38505 [Kitasatospora sp. NPDC001603]|uniref:hypothetical protein n=1 Tax=Kitasatospora sp. NPDC001603 TaxID=3154388 RepID=UPI0033295626